MKNKALYFGTFAPLHCGHESVIKKLCQDYDEVIVLVSGYDGDRGDLFGIDLNTRFELLKKSILFTKIIKIDESNITRYPDGWTQWLELLSEQLGDLNQYVFVSGEKSYEDELISRGFSSKMVDRNLIKMSASQIRDNFTLNKQYCNYNFRVYIEEMKNV